MANKIDPARRVLLRRLALGLTLAPLVSAQPPPAPGDLPLLSENDPKAKAQNYVEDASRAKDAQPGATCANCGLYGGAQGSTQGPCATLFPGKQVKAAGWCSAWASL
jgi:hypothetical protein